MKIWNWDFKNLLQKGCHRFRYHLADNPEKLEELQACQNQKTLTVAASTLVRQAEELSKNGDFESAVEKLKKAQQFDANIDLNPKTEELDNDPRVVVGKMSAPYFVTQGIERIYNGDIKEAVAAYNKALQIDPKLEISARNWNRLCRQIAQTLAQPNQFGDSELGEYIGDLQLKKHPKIFCSAGILPANDKGQAGCPSHNMG